MGKKILTHILLQMGLINEKQIDLSLKTQVMVGGKIGENIVHLEFINEDPLADALLKFYTKPPITGDIISQIGEEAKKAIPGKVVEEYRILLLKTAKFDFSEECKGPHLSFHFYCPFIQVYVIIQREGGAPWRTSGTIEE